MNSEQGILKQIEESEPKETVSNWTLHDLENLISKISTPKYKEENLKVSLYQLVDYCRYKQEQWEKGIGEQSGLEFLQQMLNTGCLPLSNYLSLYPAIENYKDPYEINIINNK